MIPKFVSLSYKVLLDLSKCGAHIARTFNENYEHSQAHNSSDPTEKFRMGGLQVRGCGVIFHRYKIYNNPQIHPGLRVFSFLDRSSNFSTDCSSVVERLRHKQHVPGSRPGSPTNNKQFDAAWRSPVACQAHNLKVGGSNPSAAPNYGKRENTHKAY